MSSSPALETDASTLDRFRDRWTWTAVVANLVGQILIIVTGGAVRLTGSGLGCSTWPECEPGEFTPRFHDATSIHPFIEFGNRTVSGAARRRRDGRRGAGGPATVAAPGRTAGSGWSPWWAC